MKDKHDFLLNTKFPNFSLKNETSNLISNGDLLGKWNVIFFYPKDDSPGCTVESCHFRDNYKSFIENDIGLYGVSTDSIDSHKKFKQKHNLQYSLLSDVGAILIKKLNLKKTFNIIRARVTFAIDPSGIIRYVHSSQLNMKGHIHKTLKAVARLK